MQNEGVLWLGIAQLFKWLNMLRGYISMITIVLGWLRSDTVVCHQSCYSVGFKVFLKEILMMRWLLVLVFLITNVLYTIWQIDIVYICIIPKWAIRRGKFINESLKTKASEGQHSIFTYSLSPECFVTNRFHLLEVPLTTILSSLSGTILDELVTLFPAVLAQLFLQ